MGILVNYRSIFDDAAQKAELIRPTDFGLDDAPQDEEDLEWDLEDELYFTDCAAGVATFEHLLGRVTGAIAPRLEEDTEYGTLAELQGCIEDVLRCLRKGAAANARFRFIDYLFLDGNEAGDDEDAEDGKNLDVAFSPPVKSARITNDIQLMITNLEELDAMARAAGVTPLSAFGLADSSRKRKRASKAALHTSRDGVTTVTSLISTLRARPAANPERVYPDVLLQELEEVLGCLRKGVSKKAKFRFVLT